MSLTQSLRLRMTKPGDFLSLQPSVLGDPICLQDTEDCVNVRKPQAASSAGSTCAKKNSGHIYMVSMAGDMGCVSD